MATEQELQQREQQLNQIEQEARKVASQKVPRRTFGSRIGPKEQQKIIENKQKAEDIIRQVQEQRQQLQQIRQPQSGGSDEQVRRYNYGRKLALSGKGAYGLTGIERQGYIDAKNQVNNVEQLKRSSGSYTISQEGGLPITVKVSEQLPQELPPVRVIDYNNRPPTIIKGEGAYDLSLEQIRNLEAQEQNKEVNKPSNYKSIENIREYIQQSDNFIIKGVRSIVNAPIYTKSGNQTIGQRSTEAVEFTSDLFNKAEEGIKINNQNNTSPDIFSKISNSLNKDARIISEITFYSATAPISLPILALSGTNRIFNAKSNEEFITGILEASPLVFDKAFKILGKTYKYLNEPIDIDISNKIYRKAYDDIFTVTNNPNQLSKFQININKQPTVITYDTRLNQIKRNILDLEEGYKLYPKQEITLNDQSTQVIRSSLGVVKEGKLLKPITVISGKKGSYFTGTQFTKLYGETNPIDKLLINQKKDIFKAVEEYLGYPISEKNFNLVFKNKEFSSGELISKDVFKLKGNKIIQFNQVGKTIRRAKVTDIKLKEKSVSESIDIIESSLNIEDITYPKLRKGKDIQLNVLSRIEDITPSETTYKFYSPNTNVKKTPFSTTLQKENIEKSLKLLNELKAQALINIPAPKSITPYKAKQIIQEKAYTSYELAPKYVGGLGLAISKFYGSGLYERTEVYGNTINLNKQNNNFKELSLNFNREIPKEISKEIPKEIVKEVPKLIPKEISKEIPKEIVKEVPKLIPKLITKNITKNPPKNIPPNPPVFRIDLPPEPPNKYKFGLFGKKEYPNNLNKGYKTYYFTKGQKVYLPEISTKEGAIFKGQKATLKSLSARFGIEETNKLVKANNVNATDRYSKYFRNYKISKGKRINTPNVFIQKLGKRLSTKTERGLIQKARRGR